MSWKKDPIPQPLGTQTPEEQIAAQSAIAKKNLPEILMRAERFAIAMSETEPENWKSLETSVKEMNLFGRLGGFSWLFAGSINRLKTQIEKTIEDAFAPLTNEISKLISKLIEEGGLKDAIISLTNDISGLVDGLSIMETKMGGVKTSTGEAATAWDVLNLAVRLIINPLGTLKELFDANKDSAERYMDSLEGVKEVTADMGKSFEEMKEGYERVF